MSVRKKRSTAGRRQNAEELKQLHHLMESAMERVIETPSDDMGISDMECGVLWMELMSVQSDAMRAMLGSCPDYLRGIEEACPEVAGRRESDE